MSVKIDYLKVAIMIMTVCLFENFNKRLFIAIVWCLFSIKYVNKDERIIYHLLILLICICSINIEKIDFTSSKIIEVRQNYDIVSNGISSIIVYTDDESAEIDDIVRIDSNIEKISATNNFDFSSFEDYCHGNKIIGSVSIDEYEIVKKASSLKHALYHNNIETGNEWANMFLFAKGDFDINSENGFFLFSGGMYASFFISLIRSYFERHYYYKTALLLTIIFTFLFLLFFSFSYGFVRVFVSLLCEYFISDKKQSLAVQILIMCFYKPYYVKSISFLLPIGLKFINLFSDKGNKLLSILYIISLQLMINGRVNLLSVLLFSLFRNIYGWIYCFAVLVSILPFRVKIDNMLLKSIEIIDKIPQLFLKGALNPLTFIILVYLLLEYSQLRQKKYLLIILLILFINSNKKAISPFYTVTFVDVGQGDCCVVTEPFSSTALMIDTGGNKYKDIAKDILIPYLDKETIKIVDVIITHEDFDHCGALDELSSNGYTRTVFRKKEEIIKKGNLCIFNPLYDENYNNENDNSNIQYFEIDRFKFLLLADITSAAEKNLVQKYNRMNPDVIKLAHHGSATSSSDILLGSYQPDLAIISAGKNNYYNHPAREVIERLNSYKIQYLNTQDDKAIRFYILHRIMLCITAENEIKIMFR